MNNYGDPKDRKDAEISRLEEENNVLHSDNAFKASYIRRLRAALIEERAWHVVLEEGTQIIDDEDRKYAEKALRVEGLIE